MYIKYTTTTEGRHMMEANIYLPYIYLSIKGFGENKKDTFDDLMSSMKICIKNLKEMKNVNINNIQLGNDYNNVGERR